MNLRSLLLNNKSAGFNPIQFILGFLIGAILFGVLSSFALVATSYPNGDGYYTTWAGTYTDVDETPHDADTTYIATSFIDAQYETYAAQDISPMTIIDISSVKVIITVRCYVSNCRNVAAMVRLSGTDSFGTEYMPTTSYSEISHIFTTKPGGGSWTESDVNAMEIGVRTPADTEGDQVRVTQIRVEVTYTGVLIGNISNPYNFIKGGISETITGQNFGASQGAGKVELCNDASCTTSPDQTVGSWTAISISITTVITGLSDGTVYLRVTENGGAYVQIALTLDTQVPTISGTSTKDEGDNYGILTNMANPPVSPSGWDKRLCRSKRIG